MQYYETTLRVGSVPDSNIDEMQGRMYQLQEDYIDVQVDVSQENGAHVIEKVIVIVLLQLCIR